MEEVELISVLPSSVVTATFGAPDEGQMASTFICNVDWLREEQTRAYVKCFRTEKGCGLINEITGFILAKHARVSVPDRAAIIQIDNEMFPDVNTADYVDFAFAVSESPGNTLTACFESEDLEKIKALQDFMNEWSGVHAALAFDDWVANQDRNTGNILINGPDEVVLIDHSNLPVNLNWAANDLDPSLCPVNMLSKILYLGGDVPESTVDKMAKSAKLHAGAFKTAHAELVKWWNIFFQSDEDRRQAIESFIQSRAASGKTRIESQYQAKAA